MLYPIKQQRGAALITSLMLLLVMTIVAIVATQNTTLNYKMSMNAVGKEVALANAENGAKQLVNVLSDEDAYISGDTRLSDLTNLPDCLVVDNDTKLVTTATAYPYDKTALPRAIDMDCSSIRTDMRIIQLNSGQLEGGSTASWVGNETKGTTGQFRIVEINSAGLGSQDIPATVSVEYQIFYDSQ